MALLTVQTAVPTTPEQRSRGTAAPDTSSGIRYTPHLTTTVPREYVHRASHAEVFLTGCEKLDDNRFALTGQWPRAHTFFMSPEGGHDALQAAETIRQTGLFLAHSELDVPLGHHFLLWDLDLTADPEQLAVGPGPSDLSLLATCTDTVRKGRRLVEFSMRVDIERAGQRCAVGGGRFSCVSDTTYRRLRGTASAPFTRQEPERMLPPASVGKALPGDVVLSASGRPGRWLLDPDPRHPILFEHAGDHFPGMVLLEAARQAARALSRPHAPAPVSFHANFHRYAEFGSPVWIEATPLPVGAAGTRNVRVTGVQQDQAVFTAVVGAQSRRS